MVHKYLLKYAYVINGFDVFNKIQFLKKTMNWDFNQRNKWRLKKLNEIIKYCWSYVPFYKNFWLDHGLRPGYELKSIDELVKFPILDRDTFVVNLKNIISKDISNVPHIEKKTGGTTSQPMKFKFDKDHWSLTQAFHFWGWSQAGYRIGDPIATVGGLSLLPERLPFKSRIRFMIERKLALLGVHMDRELAIDYHQKLKKFKTKFLFGYPSVLSEFASHLYEEKLFLTELKAVFTTSEMLLENYKRNIEKLGCAVWDHLGSNDGGFLSYECSLHDGFHYNDLQSILETHDDKLTITNLWNKSIPFIRYENGDMAILKTTPCECGIQFPVIKEIKGRTTEIFRFKNGRTMNGPSMVHIFCGMDEIDCFQIVQDTISSVKILVVSKKGLKTDNEKLIREVFRRHAGNEIDVEIKYVDDLNRTNSGKLQPVIVDLSS